MKKFICAISIMCSLSLGAQDITFSASDIFNNFGIRQEIYGDGFTAMYENYYETQVFRVGLKYKF